MGATIDLDLVGIFVAVADASSFSAAARKLSLPTSTVSRAVATLEERLRVQLLHRTTRRVALTTEGSLFFEQVAPAIATVRSALDLPRERQEPQGLLRITAAPDVGSTYLARIITRFTARYPAVRIELLSTSRVVDLLKDGFDAAIRAVRAVSTPVPTTSFVARKLTALEFQIYGSPSYLARRGVPRTPSDLSRHDWIEFRGWKHSRVLAKASLCKRIVNNDFLFIRETLRAGGGLGFLPTFLARDDVEAGSLTHVLPDQNRNGGRLVILYAKQKQLPRRVSVFRDFLLESFGERG